MLKSISIFASILFASVYPFFFWFHYPDPIVAGFRRFNLGMSCFVGGVGVIGLLGLNPGKPLALIAIIWIAALFLVSFILWNRKNVIPHLLTVPVILGVLLIGKMHTQLFNLQAMQVWSPLIGGFILCAVIYATVLGHWYLNVPGLPLEHLSRLTNILWTFSLVRLVFNLFLLFTLKVLHSGDTITLFNFLMTMDGFLLWVGIFFGTLLPAVTTYFVKGTLDVKNTQSATGILYAILVSIFMGELAYLYYLLKFGIAL